MVNKTLTAIRLDPAMLDRIDALAAAPDGLTVPRADVIRLALEIGLTALEKKRDKKRPRKG